MMCSTTLYRPFISQETYEEHTQLDTAFTEYLEQATLRRDKEKASTVQQTAEQHNKHNEALSRMRMPDAAHPGMQFPRVSSISTEDQSSFLEEYRNMLLGDLDKLELNKMKVNQELKSVILAEQDQFQQLAYQQALVQKEMYNRIPPQIKSTFEEIMCKANKVCIQNYPRYYCLHQTLGVSAGAVYRSDPVLQHEQKILQLGDVPRLHRLDSEGIKLFELGGVGVPASSEIHVTHQKRLSEDATAVRLAAQLEVDLVVASEALETLIDNEAPDYGEQWEVPVGVKRVSDERDPDGVKPRKVIFVDEPLPRKHLTPYKVNFDFYKKALRDLLCERRTGNYMVGQDDEEVADDVKEGSAKGDQREAGEELSITVPRDTQEDVKQTLSSQETSETTSIEYEISEKVSIGIAEDTKQTKQRLDFIRPDGRETGGKKNIVVSQDGAHWVDAERETQDTGDQEANEQISITDSQAEETSKEKPTADGQGAPTDEILELQKTGDCSVAEETPHNEMEMTQQADSDQANSNSSQDATEVSSQEAGCERSNNVESLDNEQLTGEPAGEECPAKVLSPERKRQATSAGEGGNTGMGSQEAGCESSNGESLDGEQITGGPAGEESSAKGLSQGMKRLATSAGEGAPLSKLRRCEDQLVSPELSENAVYTLWRFGKMKLLVQTSLDAYKENSDKTNSYSFFSVMPKLEYQPRLGFARLSSSEASRFWLHSYLRPNTRMLCGRINVHTSELAKVEALELTDILNSGVAFNPAQRMKMVWQVLNGLSPLSEGQYLLCHAPRDIHCCLFSESASAKRSGYDMHQAHSTPGEIAAVKETEIPWVALDTNRFLPQDIKHNRIPCTFPSVPAKVLAEIQAAEKPAKRSKSRNAAKRGKKKGGQAKSDVNMNTDPASHPHVRNASRKTKKKTKTGRRPGLDGGSASEADVLLSRRESAPITYDDIDFGEF